ncbi:MAG: hypothetical protein U9R74_09075 [Pseudomonadota bacterium]|nr:hypothetical protein [Pseudomonadota bacterium]
MERFAASSVTRLARNPVLVFWLVMIAWVGGASAANRFQLVSPEEFAQSQAAPQFETKAMVLPEPGAPEIVVIAPESRGRIRTPMDIRLVFVPADGARIDPDSLRILYGWLKLDITDRVMQHATMSVSELLVSGADIPVGDHKIIVRVTDDKGRTGEKSVKFTAVENVAERGAGTSAAGLP